MEVCIVSDFESLQLSTMVLCLYGWLMFAQLFALDRKLTVSFLLKSISGIKFDSSLFDYRYRNMCRYNSGVRVHQLLCNILLTAIP